MKTIPMLRALALVLTFTLAADLRAGTVTVTDNTDRVSLGNADFGTLRWAIATAAPGDTIVFAALNPSVITLSSGQLTVDKQLTIDASALVGGVTVMLPEFPEPEFTPSRIFQITNNATVEFKSLTVSNGFGVAEGGGIRNSSGCNLTLTNCTISGNSSDADGGGIYNVGALTLNSSILSGNIARGALGSTGVYVPGGNGGNASGGGIYNVGTVTLNSSSLSGNNAIGGTGGTSIQSNAGNGGSASGGGIYNADTLMLNNSTLSGNSAAAGQGGTGSSTGSYGGLGGSGSRGGGIHNAAAGTATVNWCTLSGNDATGGQGGTCSIGVIAGNGNTGGTGGGIRNEGKMTINQSTFSGNKASGGRGGYGSISLPGNGGNGGTGGGIYNSGELTLNQITLTGSSTPAGPAGSSSGSGNGTAGTGGSGGGVLNLSNCSLHNSLIALNSSVLNPDMSGAFVSQGYNLLGVVDGSTGLVNGSNNDLVGTGAAPLDPLIGSLADNGGDTFTVALLEGSPARDAGDDSITDTWDQRGLSFPRLFGGSVDIGSYEVQGIPLAPAILSQSTGIVVIDPASRFGGLSVSASVNPNNALATTVWLEYGVWDGYGYETSSVSLGYGVTGLPVSLPLSSLAPGNIWHYRVVASSAAGTTYGEDQTVTISSPGDSDGDGTVSQTELDAVIAAAGVTLFSQAQFDFNRTAGQSDVTGDPNTYNLYDLSQIQALNVGVPLIQKDGRGQFKLTIGVQKSTTLLPGSFQPFALDSQGRTTSINGAGKLEFLFSVPDNAAFFRVESK